jgi:nitrite reductase/ring-hydroxylating ferredoxin subunit
MPAWGPTHDDQRIWNMVAFLQRLPDLSAAQYQILTARGNPSAEQGHWVSKDSNLSLPLYILKLMYINFWYPICTSENLAAENPLRVEMLGVRLVAYRDADGGAHVLSDTCIHRGGSLSKGQVAGNNIQCPYHGWTFSGEGRCVRIPSHGPASFPLQGQELDVDLHVVAGDLLLVSMRVHGPPSNPIRESVESMPLADAIHGRIGRLDVVIAL